MEPPRKHIGEEALINKYSSKSILLHLAKTPIANKEKHLIKNHPQLFAFGFNVGGRPDGLWMSQGSTWLAKAKELDNPKFPVCCYIYKIKLTHHAKILRITNEKEFFAFDKEFPSYWLNMDYFTIDFTDYLNDNEITAPKKYKLDLEKLRKKPGETLRDTLINNKIIFTNIDDALTHCDFYKKTDINIERFKYKDWNAVAEKYQGIMFTWNLRDTKLMKYLWFQSLDVSSGCVWDSNAIAELKLLYNKVDATTWNHA